MDPPVQVVTMAFVVHHAEPPIPDTILEKWQKIVNLMAEMLDVPAGLIMRILGEDIHVFVSSSTEGNPYHPGDSEHFLGSGLYCETVVTKNHELLVPNALFDEAWRNNPDVKLNMISYLGYPIRWPDGEPFGTICVLDCKTNSYSEKYKRLVTQFRDIVEIHLEIIYTEAKRREELEHLVDERTASLRVAVAEQIDANNRVLSEMSQRKKTEESLRKAQDDLARISRITTMGELAATIAHEVNQPLSGVVINGNACLRWLAGVESSSPNLEQARQAVERVIRDGKRAGDVISRLRNFFKASGGERTSLKINEVVEGIVKLVRHELERNHVLLRTDLSERLPPVQGDAVQLQQVILNLILNAVDAMADVVDRPRELIIVTCSESGGVRVEVKDNGVGIEEEKLESIFQPFYTTKADGMGLGLSISRSIVNNHGGRLIAQPNNDAGTTFCFTLT
ncbi:MAG: GHKL domain-containing protein [Verrucomicrobia bacterium]|nr:GHKL domain-containing protein [Verrucomicrobiota bacterium]